MSYRVPMCYVCESKMVNPHGLAGAYGMCRDCYDEWQTRRERCVVVDDRSDEARWLRETDETRREANWRPGQE